MDREVKFLVILTYMILILILLAEVFVGVKLWNWLCPTLFGIKEITPLQFAALWAIVNILTSHPFKTNSQPETIKLEKK